MSKVTRATKLSQMEALPAFFFSFYLILNYLKEWEKPDPCQQYVDTAGKKNFIMI